MYTQVKNLLRKKSVIDFCLVDEVINLDAMFHHLTPTF